MKNSLVKNTMRKSKNILLLALLIFIFLTHLYAADIQCIWTGIEKIVAVGDLHGDFDNFKTILEGTGLIDRKLHWTGGKTHLVQIGDILDRGPDAKKIFDLMMRLEKEAEEAGGKVHALIGNHEEMNIGDVAFDREGYVTLGQFYSFLPDEYREKKEKKIRKEIGGNAPKETGLVSSLDSNLIEYWEEVRKEAMKSSGHPARRVYIRNFNKKYGKWILEHNAVIKINDIIFVHGGISEKFSKWKLENINNRLRIELDDLRWAAMNSKPPNIPGYRRQIVYEPNGPYWYRDLALMGENDFKEDVDRILTNLKAQYMVIAHTPRLIKTKDDMQRFQGRIWIIDTGISKAYGGHLSALIIEDGKFTVWPPSLRRKKIVSIEYIRQFQGRIWIIDFGFAEVIGCDQSAWNINHENFYVWG